MKLLYAIGMGGLYSIMWLAARFHPKAAKWITGRKVSLTSIPVPAEKEVVWFHCASLGEFDQGLPVMRAYKQRFPDCFLVVTFFSPSGMDFYHKRDHPADAVCYLPLDTAKNARRFVQHFHPGKVFFVKYEFWYNHLLAAKKAGAEIYGVSSLFRPTHRFFKWYGGFFRAALRLFDHFFVQDTQSANLLATIGINQVTVSGDTRYDRMWAVRQENATNPVIAQFAGSEKVIILGSSWPVDEHLFSPVLEELTRTFKLIIAPHDISPEHISAIESLYPQKTVRYTTFNAPDSRILILDSIGQLTAAYRYATLAYIGGGFTGKLHNILEPGAFGLPILIGPKHGRFPEAQLFIERGVAAEITATEMLLPILHSMIERRTAIAFELEQIFLEKKGAAEKVMDGVALA